ncbi:hypothetical protein [Notoacmeibacter ruber]|uniref:Uncharacterized protein n=1 Tax=Notoacmeibacter ruber TaxID=2670375 RepID=A0A3L7J9P4_9HYPH|nr:hypothetical protein [Notoacmeibacter ruber]RLQ87085.1 hypothetical protein D8780_01510 [Notoacmeibacter ruber]
MAKADIHNRVERLEAGQNRGTIAAVIKHYRDDAWRLPHETERAAVDRYIRHVLNDPGGIESLTVARRVTTPTMMTDFERQKIIQRAHDRLNRGDPIPDDCFLSRLVAYREQGRSMGAIE